MTMSYTVLKWPPQSPDLNLIEHLWDVVEQKLRGCTSQKSPSTARCYSINMGQHF